MRTTVTDHNVDISINGDYGVVINLGTIEKDGTQGLCLFSTKNSVSTLIGTIEYKDGTVIFRPRENHCVNCIYWKTFLNM